MAERLVASGNVTLGNITSAKVRRMTRQDCGTIKQWTVPLSVQSGGDGLPSQKVVANILEASREFAPNLIHVWGTEYFWGLLTSRKIVGVSSLLEIQGLKEPYSRVYDGGLARSERIACIGIKELINLRSISGDGKKFQSWGRFEREIIAGHRFVSSQTAWVDAWVRASNHSCKIFHSDLALREPFYRAEPWNPPANPVIFCSAAYPVPYKGLHVAIRAVAILKNTFPHVRLRIAGAHQRKGIRQNGYVAWLNRQVLRLGLVSNVEWLGPLDANEIVHELHMAAAMVVPTFIENCCTAMQEAMMVGTPVVATYTGGLPSIAKEEESALFFPIGDEVMCAYQLQRVITDRELSSRLSHTARAVAIKRNDPAEIVAKQLEIYRHVIDGDGIGKQSSILSP